MKRLKQNRTQFIVISLMIAAILLCTGCADKARTKSESEFAKWKVLAEKSKGYIPPPAPKAVDIPEDKLQGPAEPAPEQETIHRPLPKDPVSLSMNSVDLAILIRTLARSAGLNIIVNENVKGRVSVKIEKAPWDQVFMSILRTHGLDYTWEGDILRILTMEDKQSSLSRLETEQKIKSKKREIETVDPLVTRVIKINYTDAIKLKGNLENFLSKATDGQAIGSIMVDEHTNSLIIMAMKNDISILVSIIENLDQPTPQVLIEAQIVEATKETARKLGVQWGGLYHGTGSGNNYWITPGANTTGVQGSSIDTAITPTSGYASNFPAEIGDLGFTLGYVSQDIGNYVLNVQLSALEEDGKVNILSSPSITTLDNQKAIIESGKEVPYQTVEDNDVNIEFKKAVLRLEVTPHVIDDRILKLDIKTSKDELDFANAVGGQPAITTKRAETNVMLLDGQTTVIGGLSKENINRSEAGAPYLSKIPVLGWLFKRDQTSRDLEDVLIFITPHILKKSEDKKPE